MVYSARILVCLILCYILPLSTSVALEVTQSQSVLSTTIKANKLLNPQVLPDTILERVIPLSVIAGNNDIIVSNQNPNYNFYPPIPSAWDLHQVKLHLMFNYTANLASASQLTLFLNGKPVASTLLPVDKSNQNVWDVVLPNEALLAGALPEVKLSAYLQLPNTDSAICQENNNIGGWVKVSKSSTITYRYKQRHYEPDLLSFLYPFIHPESEWPLGDKDIIVLTRPLSVKTLLPILQFSSFLKSNANWRGLDLDIKSLNSLSEQDKQEGQFIFIDTADNIKQFSSVLPNLPLTIGNDGFFYQPNGQKVAQDTGVIMLIKSPWESNNQTLVISGKTSQAVQNAITAIQQPSFLGSHYGNYALISGPVLLTESDEANWNKVTFDELGYADSTVIGLGKNTLYYNIKLPNDKTPRALTVYLNFSHSGLVSTAKSLATIRINGIPVDTLLLNVSNEKDAMRTINIPQHLIRPGANILEAVFDLHMPGEQTCDQRYISQAWAVVSNTSYIKATFNEQPPHVNLSQFIIPFDSNTLVVLSDKLHVTAQQDILNLTGELAKQLGDKIGTLTFLLESQVTLDDLKKNNTIFIGNLNDSPLLKLALNKANEPTWWATAETNIANQAVALLTNKTAPYGFLELADSPWKQYGSILVVTGNQDDGLTLAVNALIKPQLRNNLTGRVAVINSDKQIKAFNAVQKYQINSKYYYWLVAAKIAVALIGLGFIIMLIVRYKTRGKKRDSKKKFLIN